MRMEGRRGLSRRGIRKVSASAKTRKRLLRQPSDGYPGLQEESARFMHAGVAVQQDDPVPPARSAMMARIGQKDTAPEVAVRRVLHRLGFRFRLHRRDLPGTPDIVLVAQRIALLVHGCFWHRHLGCRFAYNPKSRVDFWRAKFDRNVVRDNEVDEALTELGWKVHVIWECETNDISALERRLLKIVAGKNGNKTPSR